MKRYLQYAMAATTLSFGAIGVASAQMTHSSADGMKAMHGGNGMQHTQGGSMMSMMMGNDPVAGCTSMMKKVAADPTLHRKLNALMHSQMGSHHGVTGPSTVKS